jgi:hypothetical protein
MTLSYLTTHPSVQRRVAGPSTIAGHVLLACLSKRTWTWQELLHAGFDTTTLFVAVIELLAAGRELGITSEGLRLLGIMGGLRR